MALRSEARIDSMVRAWESGAIEACTKLARTFDAENDNAQHFDAVQRRDLNETAMPYAETLLYVESRAAEKKYPNLRALDFVPVDNEIPEDADEYEYYMRDWVGELKWASTRAEDFPMVTWLGVKQRGRLDWYHGGYEYWKREIAKAVKAGVQLDASLAKALYKAAAEFVDKGVTRGNPAAGFFGFVNNSNVTTDGAGQLPNGGDWLDGAVTGAEILGDLLYMADRIKRATNSAYVADWLILPLVVEDVLSTKFVMVGNDVVDVLTRFKRLRPKTNVDFWSQLNTADAAGTGPRAISYQRDLEVLRAIVPKPFTTEPPQAHMLAVQVFGEGSCGGTNIKQTAGVRYYDDLVIP